MRFPGQAAAVERGIGNSVHNDVVDGDMHQLHKKADKPHHEEADGRGVGNLLELCVGGTEQQMSMQSCC